MIKKALRTNVSQSWVKQLFENRPIHFRRVAIDGRFFICVRICQICTEKSSTTSKACGATFVEFATTPRLSHLADTRFIKSVATARVENTVCSCHGHILYGVHDGIDKMLRRIDIFNL